MQAQPFAEAAYIAADAADDFERNRLNLLAKLMNPMTIRRLERLGVEDGWRCLEVGAGEGSIARWLAGRVGRRGHVVATDMNPRFLNDFRSGNVEVRTHDILHDDLETGHYDLVHCRALLMHLPDPARAITRMAAALRTGGWLLVEEGDLATFRALDPVHPAIDIFDRVHRVGADIIARSGLVDVYFGRRCRDLLQRAGLVEVEDDATTWFCRGGSLEARFQQMNLKLAWPLVSKADGVSEDDYERLHRLYDDPSFAFVHMAMVGAWGRRDS